MSKERKEKETKKNISFRFQMKNFATLLIAVLTMAKAQQYINTPIDSPSGIYFEGISKIRMTKGQWTILTSLTIEDILRQTQPLTVVTSNYGELCRKLIHECRPYYLKLHSWYLADQDIRSRWAELKDFVRPMGVSLETDYRFHSSEIPKGERDLLSAILPYSSSLIHTDTGKQTTHIPSGLKGMIKVLDDRKGEVKRKINEISDKNLTTEETIDIFSDITEITDNIVNLRTQLYTSFTAVISNAKIGLIHPLTFVPEELRMTLRLLSVERRDMTLPLLQDGLGLTHLRDVTKTKLIVKDGLMIIMWTIPFIEINDSYLYYLHPHPVLQYIGQNTQVFGQISGISSHLVFNNITREYAFPSPKYLEDSCKPNSQYLICNPTLTFYPTNDESRCELSLLNGKNPDKCDIRITNSDKNQWIPLRKPGHWLYSLIQPLVGQLICPHYPVKQLTLSRHGRLTLKNGCQFSAPDLLLLAVNTTFNIVTPPDVIPNKTLILHQLFPDINRYEKLFQFNTRNGYTNEIPLTYILRAIAQKLYYDNKPLKLTWNWEAIALTALTLILLVYLIKITKLAEKCLRYFCCDDDEEGQLTSEEAPFLPETNRSVVLLQHQPSQNSEAPESHYQVPPRPTPISSPVLTFKGPLQLSNNEQNCNDYEEIHPQPSK